MKTAKIASVVCFALLTGWVTLHAMTGPGLETYPDRWVETAEMTREETRAAVKQRAIAQKESRLEERRNRQYDLEKRRNRQYDYSPIPSVRRNSGGNSWFTGRVK